MLITKKHFFSYTDFHSVLHGVSQCMLKLQIY